MKIIHLFSGGLDSTVMLYDLLAQQHAVRCLMFNYGQKHLSELRYARATCDKLKVPCDEVELCRIKHLFLRCALTDGKGGNVVPNRNGVFLNIAAAIAASLEFDAVVIASNKDDAKHYDDCSPMFMDSIRASVTASGVRVGVFAPYITKTKKEVVERGRKFNVPFDETMSCYEGNNCGKCAACKLRKKALK